MYTGEKEKKTFLGSLEYHALSQQNTLFIE